MRHRVGYRKLGRVTEHRISMLRNQAQSLLRHERIETTVPKARELRPFVERLITIAKRSLKHVTDNGKTHPKRLYAQRLVAVDIHNKAVVEKLFVSIAPRYEGRAGGYTRLLKIGHRRGDNAEVAQVELLGSEYNPNLEKATEETTAPAKPRGVRSRLQAAASRLRGGKDGPESSAAAGADKGKHRTGAPTPRRHSAPKKTGGE